MLIELKVSNFAIIENLHIQFKKGLNILSGETGAGKSVLLKGLSLLMGHKGSTESIRSGANQASIEGSFDISSRPDIKDRLQEMGIEVEDDVLVVRRLLSEDKSRVYLNGTLSTLNALRDIVAPLIEVAGHTAPLIEMTGQHENRNLLSKTYHLDLVDHYAGNWELRNRYSSKYSELQLLKKEIETLRAEARNREQRLDFLRFQRNEIASLELQPGEEATLETEVKKMKNSARIGSFADTVENVLYSDDDSAISRIHFVLQKSNEILTLDPGLGEKLQSLEQAKTLITDCVYDLRQYASRIDASPEDLERHEQRLSDLRKLQKKYGPTADAILEALAKIEEELNVLENFDSHLEALETKTQVLLKELQKIATDLHKRRENSSVTLAKSVNAELLDLNMKGVTFHVSVQKLDELNLMGITDLEFMSQTSPKDPARSLSKFASGGELSRILLSLKRVVGSSDQPRTYLFDEVDTGVSGPTAEKVGKKLRSIAKGQQVICVTHLPQVAACGDVHFFIQKSPKRGAVSMEINELSAKERVSEIARLISGEKISKTSLAHAQQLLSEV